MTALLHDPGRLAALEDIHLRVATSAGRLMFDRMACLAADLLEAPVALVCIVEADRQMFLGARGLSEPVATTRQTSLGYSILPTHGHHRAAPDRS